MLDNVNVVCRDLKVSSVDGYVKYVPEEDWYTIVLNDRQSINAIREAYDHELRHIIGDDYKKHGVQNIEYLNHKED